MAKRTEQYSVLSLRMNWAPELVSSNQQCSVLSLELSALEMLLSALVLELSALEMELPEGELD